MRIPLTKFGLPQLLVIPAAILLTMLIYFALACHLLSPLTEENTSLAFAIVYLPELLLLIIMLWVFSFFRDPERDITDDPDVLLSPADGTITDIVTVTDSPDLPGQYLRIGIFLSIFNVHINRTPCPVKIKKITYKKGRYTNALNPHSGRVNEANDILMTRLNDPKDTILVRQISGAIARRIVCNVQIGQEFTGGYKFGMLKFGSRTELYLPTHQKNKCLIKVKDKVKAGLTIIIKYEK